MNEQNTDIKNLTVDQLKDLRKKILDSNAHWKSCQDGSYEMALHYSGLQQVDEELKSRVE